MSHVHVHAPHELTEKEEAAGKTTRSERVLELCAVLLLSISTLATAWSGYQAARWSGEQSQDYASASAVRINAQRASTASGQLRIADQILFNNWLNAHASGEHGLEAEYSRRFRPEFRPAFRAWLAQHPFTNRKARPGPLYMPQYRLTTDAQAKELDAKADDLFSAGTDAKSNDDKYILSTVFFAAVLFSAGISLRFEWRPLRIAVLCLAGTMLLVGTVYVLTLPVA